MNSAAMSIVVSVQLFIGENSEADRVEQWADETCRECHDKRRSLWVWNETSPSSHWRKSLQPGEHHPWVL